jgi:hypothetical protein
VLATTSAYISVNNDPHFLFGRTVLEKKRGEGRGEGERGEGEGRVGSLRTWGEMNLLTCGSSYQRVERLGALPSPNPPHPATLFQYTLTYTPPFQCSPNAPSPPTPPSCSRVCCLALTKRVSLVEPWGRLPNGNLCHSSTIGSERGQGPLKPTKRLQVSVLA